MVEHRWNEVALVDALVSPLCSGPEVRMGGRRSGVLQPNGIVNRLPKLLLAPEIALRCLDRCAAEEELDLLQLAAREMA